MNPKTSFSLVAGLALAFNANAGSKSPLLEESPQISEPSSNWWEDFNNWSLFDGKITASLYGNAIYGGTTGEISELHPVGHDPQREGWTVQGFEPSISLRPTEHIEGFVTGVLFTDSEGEWAWEWEEVFGVLRDLPGGFDLRGGQFYNRVGIQNTHHLHAWQQTDMPLVINRMLGEHGLLTRSGEVNWRVPIGDPLTSTTMLTASYGEVLAHDHAHGGHGHGGHEHEEHADHEFEGEGAVFSDRVFSARAMHRMRKDDFNELTLGASYIYGDNEFGRHNHIVGIDGEYVWRENGLEPGGRALRWRTEVFAREVNARSGELHEEGYHDDHGEDHHEEDHHEEHGDHDEHDDHEEDHHGDEMITDAFMELGLYTSLTYTWNDHWDTGVRLGYVSGISELGLDERFRVSPNVTFYPLADRRLHLRAQYNYDHGSSFGDEHSVWLQAGFSFGAGNEVR